jgi:post-segregation antitoxin (ccd killing protein)
MATFDIYFRQVNQSRYTVEAETEDQAIKMAEKQWREENNPPALIHVETYDQTGAPVGEPS